VEAIEERTSLPLFASPSRCFACKFISFSVKYFLSSHIIYSEADHKYVGYSAFERAPSSSSELLVFWKFCTVSWRPFCIFCYVSHAVVSGTNPSSGTHIPFPGLTKRPYHGWLSIMTSTEGPFFSLASHLNPNSTTDC